MRVERKTGIRAAALAGAILLGLGICGCGDGGSLQNVKRTEKGYSLPEIRILASTEKNRWEEMCTAEIWDAPVGDEENFGQYLTEEIRRFADELRILNLMAEEYEVTLTPEERSAMTEAAKVYYGNLTEADRAATEITQEAAQRMFEDYCRAEKLTAGLTDQLSLEVSDSEAKVIRVKEVKTEDEGTAGRMTELLQQPDRTFESCAGDLSLEVTERRLGREDMPDSYEEAAFALAAGERSDVIEAGGSFYVLECISDYDADETAARKELIYEERRRIAFRDVYDSYSSGIHLIYSGDPWEKLQTEEVSCSADADFFEIYNEFKN